MRYISTRGQTPPHSFSEAVATGLAPDGGLFLPETLPDFSADLARFAGLGYAELCFEFMRVFATDIPPGELRALVAASYRRFSDPTIAPLRPLGRNLYALELFHGPSLAFKDFALQLLGQLYARQCALRGEKINVLGATSGDTGAAAIQALLGRPGIAVFILYPDGRVAPLQERQMACTGSGAVFALAVDGSFDDAQSALKAVLGDGEFRRRYRLSAVNSINLARVLAQCVYYLHAWLRLPAGERAGVEFVVPTGNFGNVLAGWMLRKMGVPIRGFKVATNQNDILYRFFTTGQYRADLVRPSLAPSMDIQVASNFERFRYYCAGADPAAWPEFTASRCTDAEIPGIIRRVYREHGYIIDPHTACAFQDLNPDRLSVVLATASPAKFPETIRAAIGVEPTDPALEALKTRPIVKHRLPADPEAIRAFIGEHAV
jgi:threonine synthase